jgi:RNA polymerase sigma-70 factor (ECF subfamily)
MGTESDRRDRFERMFHAHYGHVLAYAQRRAQSHVAQDVVAETFMVAWRRLDHVPTAAELPWLYGVARRVLANELRGDRRRGALVERAGSAQAPAAVDAAGDVPLVQALARLGARDRELLLLTAWEGLSPAEAAAAMGCSRAAVRVRLHRARKRLATELEQEPLRQLTTSLEER